MRRFVLDLVQALALDRVQRLAPPHRIVVAGRGAGAGKFEGFGNLTKALAFPAERAARIAAPVLVAVGTKDTVAGDRPAADV